MPSDAATERRLTILGALDSATAALARAGLDTPRQEAVRLVADLLGLAPGELILKRASVIEPDRRRWIERAVARRVAGEPLAHVTGLAGFRHLTLRSDGRALIPRPETEGLVDRVLATGRSGCLVDVGTGSGCIALACRQEGQFDRVLAIDCSGAALDLARHNVRATGLAVDLVCGDLTTGLATGSVDVLVSNPPYLSESEYLALDSSVAGHEPRLALVSGVDGLHATGRVLAEARRVLRPGGMVAVEIASARPDASAAAARAAGLRSVRIEQDLFDRPRYLLAQQEN